MTTECKQWEAIRMYGKILLEPVNSFKIFCSQKVTSIAEARQLKENYHYQKELIYEKIYELLCEVHEKNLPLYKKDICVVTAIATILENEGSSDDDVRLLNVFLLSTGTPEYVPDFSIF